MIKDIITFSGLTCTINTTEDCNLRCKYCYETNKRPVSITFDKCKKFIDLILHEGDICQTDDEFVNFFYRGRIIDFIGGDSLMDVDLLDKVLRYFNYKWSLIDHSRVPLGWRCSITSNGTLFSDPKVKAFLEKWHENISLTVSLDGCPEIHDMNRVYKDGTGTMKDIMKNWEWFRKWFPNDCTKTKATCSRQTIPYLYDSLRFLHEDLGLTHIHQNFIMEDTGCTEEDYKELDRQLEKCCQYCLDHSNELYWSMLGPEFVMGRDMNEYYTRGRCGSGTMPCLSIDGNIYPCFRWLPHTQNGKVGVMCVGNVDDGFSQVENFKRVCNGSIRANCTRDPKCKDCEYEQACAYCIGGCYAEFGDFIRTTYICEITKLQCKWAKVYWDEFNRRNKKES